MKELDPNDLQKKQNLSWVNSVKGSVYSLCGAVNAPAMTPKPEAMSKYNEIIRKYMSSQRNPGHDILSAINMSEDAVLSKQYISKASLALAVSGGLGVWSSCKFNTCTGELLLGLQHAAW